MRTYIIQVREGDIETGTNFFYAVRSEDERTAKHIVRLRAGNHTTVIKVIELTDSVLLDGYPIFVS